ncbi:response regulator [Chondromyces apiculatus]|uniref:histidine kinase n=1 Tax=Chondromyces apiculatus DSM 436 TaxID=1192034 RepID=A0A017T732_9BACT|nr:response regulator [Chondromyces apiculatus]EYF04595.1 sensory box histidine kinase/response regulator [Chondromyces apiculatus DSM 436]
MGKVRGNAADAADGDRLSGPAIDVEPERGRVWVVEDSPTQAELARRVLSPLHHVELLPDAAAALVRVGDTLPDVLVLDWHLPGMSGLELCRTLRQTLDEATLPILMMTGHAREHEVVEALEAGANDYVTKPYHPPELRARVGTLARLKRLYQRAWADQRRQRLLAEAGARMSASLDLGETLASVLRLAVPELATLAAVELLEGPAEERGALLLAHSEPEVEARLRALPRSPVFKDHPLRTALRSEHPLLVHGPDEVLERLSLSPAHRQELALLGLRSAMIVPLSARGQVLGLLYFASSDQGYTAEDLQLAEELGRRAALSFDNARFFETAQRERARAEDANRAKDEFLAMVSHELRTPLNAILGWIRMLQLGALSSDKRARALDIVERNAHNQLALIEDLLDVSRIISGKLRLGVQEVDPVKIVESALDAVRPAADAKDIRLKPAITPTGLIPADPDRLLQVASNLLTNAVKFTPRGGRVEVSLARIADSVELAVVDTGRGISPDFLPHVFERFRQAEGGQVPPQGGLGLGLAIVRHIIELHGGTIEAFSEGEGKGARFTVRLPVALPKTEGEGRKPSPGALEELRLRCDLQGVHVLVVDDAQDARDLIASILEACGARVTTASSAPEGLEALKAGRPDLLISDIGMPGQSGYDLISRVRTLPAGEGGRTPAVALTGHAHMEDRTRALVAGFQTHVPKPIDPTELVLVVATAVGRMPSP